MSNMVIEGGCLYAGWPEQWLYSWTAVPAPWSNEPALAVPALQRLQQDVV